MTAQSERFIYNSGDQIVDAVAVVRCLMVPVGDAFWIAPLGSHMPVAPPVWRRLVNAPAGGQCPHQERCPSCRCVLDAGHDGDHDIHCGNGPR